MQYKKKIYNKKIEKKLQSIRIFVFILSIGALGLISIISLNVAINQGKIKLNPRIADEYTLAQEYYRKKDYNKAKSILKKEIAATIDPKKEYEANILLGKIYNDTGNYEEALKIFSSVSNSLYFDEELKHNIGITYLNMEMYDDALVTFEEALSINSNYVPTLLTIGKFYMDRDLPRLAKGYYERVLKLEENDEAMFNVGIIALNEGMQSLAYDTLSKLVRKSNNEYADMAANVLGDIYVIAGDTDSAIEMYLKSLANSKTQVESVKRLVKVYEQVEDYDSIKKVYEQILNQNPNDINTMIALGNLYEEENNYDKAVKYYYRLSKIKNYTNAYEAIGLLANAYYKGNKLDEAEDNYKKIIMLDKKDDLYKTALERLGDITYRQKAFTASLKYYKEIYTIETNKAIFKPRLGELELYYGNSDRGIKLLENSIKESVGNAFPSRTLAIYYESIGNYNEALNYYNYTLSKYPNDRESLYRAGMLYYKNREYKKANESLLVAANDENNTTFIRETAWKTLSTMMEEIRLYNEASSYYRQLVEISPKVENYMLYGNYCYRRLQYDDAIYAYSEALTMAEEKKEMFDINLALGKCYFRLNELDNAEESYRNALSYDGGDYQAKEGLRQVLNKKK
ncbi:tetratricopeptide repeat protein [Brachyspira pilosicoli]|uniref:Tetratricopeptide repeat protein n=1 Tax=Brachyspira pilosicoli TaxID=52584 RepID=A0A5C8F3E6_BRAPL|nr:tetratricopeptide repeat protein [Brachyspira pilosicoli]TXJ43060.1 tetratricopeptide repeat protein [Brachyspira pilosicoli]